MFFLGNYLYNRCEGFCRLFVCLFISFWHDRFDILLNMYLLMSSITAKSNLFHWKTWIAINRYFNKIEGDVLKLLSSLFLTPRAFPPPLSISLLAHSFFSFLSLTYYLWISILLPPFLVCPIILSIW